MIGQPFDCDLRRAMARRRRRRSRSAMRGALAAGKVIEFDGRRKQRRGISGRSQLLGLAGHRGIAIWRDHARHFGPQARGRENPVSRGTRYADRPRQPQHAARASGRDDCRGRDAAARWRCWCSASTAFSRSTTCSATPAATWCSCRGGAAEGRDPARASVARLSGDEFAIAICGADIGGERRPTSPSRSLRASNAADRRQPPAPRQGQHRRGGLSGWRQTADELFSNGHLALSRAKADRARRPRAFRGRDPA